MEVLMPVGEAQGGGDNRGMGGGAEEQAEGDDDPVGGRVQRGERLRDLFTLLSVYPSMRSGPSA